MELTPQIVAALITVGGGILAAVGSQIKSGFVKFLLITLALGMFGVVAVVLVRPDIACDAGLELSEGCETNEEDNTAQNGSTVTLLPFVPQVIQSEEVLDSTLAPSAGMIDLNAGFLPDPHIWSIIGGGTIDVSSVGSECRGYATPQANYQLNWSGNSNFLRIFFVGQGDTTLIIYGADGRWYCNDDSFGTRNPTIDFPNPRAGVYDIWVGSYSSGQNISGILYITEISSNDPSDFD